MELGDEDDEAKIIDFTGSLGKWGFGSHRNDGILYVHMILYT